MATGDDQLDQSGRLGADLAGADEPATEARAFLEAFHQESGRWEQFLRRWAAVRRQIEWTGRYEHTRAELTWGARVAWRQSVRCVGRIRWRNLVVRDARQVVTADGVYRELVTHLRHSTNSGRIRSTITIFPADLPAGPRVRIWNEQLVRYAGYRDGGAVTGDPRNAGFTDMAMQMGWRPPAVRGRYDVLPWIIETAAEAPRLYRPPLREILEVPIRHPDLPWLADLRLRWHAVPVISNMRLRIGGIDYSCAPFGGWYMGDEIATRDLGDRDRYDMLPVIAHHLGLDTSSNASMWRQRACLELNVAVHDSFRAAGVTVSDALTESDLFAKFAGQEEAAGRACYANWSWVNGHFAAPLGEAFHRYYDTREPNPNFWLGPDAAARAAGRPSGPTLVGLHRSSAAVIRPAAVEA
jgi:nitric-oxide synthase